jgi:hypothetical protein
MVVAEQDLQVGLHLTQVCPLAANPAGQVETQVLSNKKSGVLHNVQV